MKPHWPTPPQNLRPTPPQMPHRPLFQLLGKVHHSTVHIFLQVEKINALLSAWPSLPCHQGNFMSLQSVTRVPAWWCPEWRKYGVTCRTPLSLSKSKLRSPCRRKSTWCKLPCRCARCKPPCRCARCKPSCRCANSTLLHQVATTSGANGPRSTPGHTDRALLQIFISIPSFLYFTMWTPFSIERIRAPSLSTCNLHSWVIFPVLRATFFGGNILTITCSQWTCEKSALLIWSNH